MKNTSDSNKVLVTLNSLKIAHEGVRCRAGDKSSLRKDTTARQPALKPISMMIQSTFDNSIKVSFIGEIIKTVETGPWPLGIASR